MRRKLTRRQTDIRYGKTGRPGNQTQEACPPAAKPANVMQCNICNVVCQSRLYTQVGTWVSMWCWWKMVSHESTNSSTMGLSRVLRSCTTLANDSPCVRTPLTDTRTDPTHGRRATLPVPAALIPVDLADRSNEQQTTPDTRTCLQFGGRDG